MYLDLLLLFLVILFGIVGYIQGFVKQILSILCWISLFLFASPLGHWLKNSSGWTWFEDAPLFVTIGMSGLMIVALLMITGGIVHYARRNSILEPTDRWIGAGLGTLKGILVAFLVALTFQIVPDKVRERFSEFHADAQSSWFTKGVSGLIDSKAFSLTEHLAEIRNELKKGETFRLQNAKTNPWNADLSADTQ